jgi:hypothetical protein
MKPGVGDKSEGGTTEPGGPSSSTVSEESKQSNHSKMKQMLDAAKGVGEAEEGEPKDKSKRLFEKAKEDFLDEFSTVDKDGNPKIPKDEGEALAEILAKALMALMTPVKMGAAASGLTEKKDEALDATADWAKNQVGDLLSKMKGLYNKDEKNEELFETTAGNQPEETSAQLDEQEVGGASPAPETDSASDLSDKSEAFQNVSNVLVKAGLVEEGLDGIKNSLKLAVDSVEVQSGDPTAKKSEDTDAVRDSVLSQSSPQVSSPYNQAAKAAENISASNKSATPTPKPGADDQEDTNVKLGTATKSKPSLG